MHARELRGFTAPDPFRRTFLIHVLCLRFLPGPAAPPDATGPRPPVAARRPSYSLLAVPSASPRTRSYWPWSLALPPGARDDGRPSCSATPGRPWSRPPYAT